MSLENVLLLRRSIRSFTDDPVKLKHLAMILWAADGITEKPGYRTAPSAGATYPINLYAVIGERCVVGDDRSRVPAGAYLYDVLRHSLVLKVPGDLRARLQEAALKQLWISQAPVSVVITAIYSKVTSIYGKRGRLRYVPMEAGHVAQNIYLMATALGYGTVGVAAFNDEKVSTLLSLQPGETPLLIMPLGVPRKRSSMSMADLNVFFESMRNKT